jgi:hypothetical protein
MTIEQHMRAELRNAPTVEERRQIETERKATFEALVEKYRPD